MWIFEVAFASGSYFENFKIRMPSKFIEKKKKKKIYRESRETQEANKDVGVFGRPVFNDVFLLNVQVLLGPREIGKEPVHLIVRVQIAGHVLAETQRKRYRGNHQRHNARIQETTVTYKLFLFIFVYNRQYLLKSVTLVAISWTKCKIVFLIKIFEFIL